VRFKVDENLPTEAVALLGKAGHDAISVLAQGLGGDQDALIAAVCTEENRALITLDTDFADIRAYPPAESPGIIVLRLSDQRKDLVLQSIKRLARILESESVHQQLWIVESGRIRIRE